MIAIYFICIWIQFFISMYNDATTNQEFRIKESKYYLKLTKPFENIYLLNYDLITIMKFQYI